MVEIGSHHYPFLPVAWILADRYESIDRIGSVSVPLLVVAGDADRIVPLAQSRRLFEAARDPKRLRVFTGIDHNDRDLLDGPELVREVTSFLAGLSLP